MEENEVELTPAGLKSKDALLNLNKSRMRAIYYRPDGQPTTPLPADPYSIAYYFAKGLKGVPPKLVSCPECEFEAKSTFGLQSHLRTHNKSKKEV